MIAATPSARQRGNDQDYDNGDLLQLFDTVNKRFFDDRIQADVRWEIPVGSVAVFTGTDRQPLTADSPIHPLFQQACTLLRRNDPRSALPLLIQCTDAGHKDAHLLLNHLLLRLNDERWPLYVKRYNHHLDSHQAVPAACYYPEKRVIAIHPYIRERKAPQFVLKYLLFHECCHQLIPSDTINPHPPAFMEWEYRAPGRTRALEWLAKEGFPTLPLPSDGT